MTWLINTKPHHQSVLQIFVNHSNPTYTAHICKFCKHLSVCININLIHRYTHFACKFFFVKLKAHCLTLSSSSVARLTYNSALIPFLLYFRKIGNGSKGSTSLFAALITDLARLILCCSSFLCKRLSLLFAELLRYKGSLSELTYYHNLLKKLLTPMLNKFPRPAQEHKV